MTTALDICARALRKARILGYGEAPDADSAAAALDDLNMMLAAWALAGVDTNHVTLDQNDAFPLADEFEEGTVYMLAARLRTDMGYPVDFDPDDFFRRIQAAYVVPPVSAVPAALLRIGKRA